MTLSDNEVSVEVRRLNSMYQWGMVGDADSGGCYACIEEERYMGNFCTFCSILLQDLTLF